MPQGDIGKGLIQGISLPAARIAGAPSHRDAKTPTALVQNTAYKTTFHFHQVPDVFLS